MIITTTHTALAVLASTASSIAVAAIVTMGFGLIMGCLFAYFLIHQNEHKTTYQQPSPIPGMSQSC